MPSFAVTAHLPVVGGRSGSDGARFGALREASVFLGADPQHSDDKRVAEAHHDDREHEENDELVPGERDALHVAVEVVVAARHDRGVAAVVVVQHLPRVLRFQRTQARYR